MIVGPPEAVGSLILARCCVQLARYLMKKTYDSPSPVKNDAGDDFSCPQDSPPPNSRNAYHVDVACYSPHTAVEVQRQQIEKMSKHIADLKAAELDLAVSEMEAQRRQLSEIMKVHNLEIEQLKGTISQTTEELELTQQKACRDVKRMKGFLKEAKSVIEKQQLKIRKLERQAAEWSKRKGLAATCPNANRLLGIVELSDGENNCKST